MTYFMHLALLMLAIGIPVAFVLQIISDKKDDERRARRQPELDAQIAAIYAHYGQEPPKF